MTQELYVQAGSRIRELREKRGYSRELLAEKADISSKFLYEIEVGTKGFSARTLSMLADGLSTSCDYILYGVAEYESKEEIDYILQQFPDEKTTEIIKILNAICQLAIFST
ncbi:MULTISPECIES: helix-turn-helix domain-containing protein [Blautia]|uniref:helix-turn-helix domain-containing protein n=1 Tax=Blautia TaxID=572511 RepID=UPI000BA42703|nr:MULTISPECIES: helix-turn-helix transcriptional regulator [Blautia]